MKNKNIFKALIVLTIPTPVLTNCSTSGTHQSYSIQTKIVDRYETFTKVKQIELCFINNVTSIPYIRSETLLELLPHYLENEQFSLKVDTNTKSAIITKERNKSTMTIDCQNDELIFSNRNYFIAPFTQEVDLDFILDATNSEDNNKIFKKVDVSSSYHHGKENPIKCGAYNIDLVWANNDVYIPLQTINDFVFDTPIAYNGEVLVHYDFDNINDTNLSTILYKNKGKERDEKLINFNYNSLCMYYDYVYGLKEGHKIYKLDEFLTSNNKKEPFLSKDAKVSSLALKNFIDLDIDDVHSRFKKPSIYSNDFNEEEKESYGITYNFMTSNMVDLIHSFQTNLPNDDYQTHFYKESGDTAFIYFPSFEYDGKINYYEDKYKPSESNTWFKEKNDTIGLIQHAHKRITSNPNIKNVVLDLSLNKGGEINPAQYIVSWMMGFPIKRLNGSTLGVMPGFFYVQDNTSKSTYSSGYLIDTNLDHKFNELDVLGNYDVRCFCLTSNISFSAANYVPSNFKGRDRVTLIGQDSAGGSCNVRLSLTADGTLFQMSDRYQLCTYRNGTFTPNELGISPDVYMEDTNKFYEPKEDGDKVIYRGQLIDFIHSIK